jgi:hypothetical protein
MHAVEAGPEDGQTLAPFGYAAENEWAAWPGAAVRPGVHGAAEHKKQGVGISADEIMRWWMLVDRDAG